MSSEGDIRVVRSKCYRHECEECGEPATKKHSYLLPNARRNPASSAYGRDDCSWCQDEVRFTCDAHPRKPRVDGYEWCATFEYNERFKHMFMDWREISNEVIQAENEAQP